MAARLAIVVLGALVAMSTTGARAADYYVSSTGSDTNPGTEAAPFASWSKAQSVVAPGDTAYFRGGRFRYTDATSDCAGSTSATVNAIVLSKSGTADKVIRYWAYPGEKPIFDFSGITDTAKYNCRQAGVRVTANYLHLKGLEFTGARQLNNLNHESWCVYVFGGSHNLFEQLDAHHNMGPGFFIQRGSDNTFLNCDSHENEDTLTSNGDGQSADGFGCHPNRVGDTGNVFRGCRAWWNTDDGWDFINAAEACTVEHSWAWYNGYKPDAVNNGQPVSLASGNGNGFKGGGYGLPPADVPAKVPQHVLRFNLALFNKAAGFYANHSPNSPIFHNNTGYKNGVNFNLLGVGSDGSTEISVGLLRNNLAFGGSATSNATLSGPIDTADNSWDAQAHVTVANADFQSVTFAAPTSCPAAYAAGGSVCVPASDTTSFAGLASARLADGSLPALPFLHLAETSMLIDRGQDVGLPFVGKAPDLGAFEYGSDARAVGGMAGSAANGGRGDATAMGGAPGGAGRTAPGGSSAGPRAGTGAAPSPGNRPSGGGDPSLAGSRAPIAGRAGTEMPAADGGTSESAGALTAKQASGCGCQLASRRGGGSGVAIGALLGLCVYRRRRSFNSLHTPHARWGRRTHAQEQA